MHWTQVLLISIVAAVLVVGATHVFWRSTWTPAYARAWSAPDGGAGRHGGGWRHGQGGRGIDHVCAADAGAWIDDLAVIAERRLEVRADQRAAWRDLVATARDGANAAAAACAETDSGAGATPPARLARMEALLAAGAGAVGRLRPAFEGFYATASETQRATLEELASREHRR